LELYEQDLRHGPSGRDNFGRANSRGGPLR
jgi:hypothetical protein